MGEIREGIGPSPVSVPINIHDVCTFAEREEGESKTRWRSGNAAEPRQRGQKGRGRVRRDAAGRGRRKESERFRFQPPGNYSVEPLRRVENRRRDTRSEVVP